MSYYSPVMPISALLNLARRIKLDPYQLILAHDVNNHPQEYRELMNLLPEGSIVILDNSLIELGKPVSTYDLWRAVTELQEHIAAHNHKLYIVLPDELCEKDATIKLSLSSLKEMGTLPPNAGVMVAAQGNTDLEAIECIEAISKEITCPLLVGVPRIVASLRLSRYSLIEGLRNKGYAMHLLGMSTNIDDDFHCAKYSGVLGIDSASPMRCGYEGSSYTIENLNKTMPRESFFNLCRSVTENMLVNYGYVKGRIS